ncbi:MAG: MerR family transcriptional regulator [Methylobacteriaceae bacterium]|nr:MerR family transcriptional regulator [Methylobacteriaceae bacterium]
MERGLESSFAGADGSADLRAAQQAGDRLFTIGDMARAYRVTLRALRFYEDRGLIRPIRHGVSRFYDAAARARFETILRGKQLGFTLTQIYAMLPKEGPAASAGSLALEESQVLSQIAQLEKKREELDTALAALRETHGRMAGENGTAASAA